MIFGLLLVILVSVTGQLTNEEECVELWLRQKPELRNRFTVDQIRWLCQRTADWLNKALNPSGLLPADDITTPRQKQYLNQLRNCTGSQCLQNIGVSSGLRNEPMPTPMPSNNRQGRSADLDLAEHEISRRQADQRAYRKEIRMMSDDERRRYQNAIVRLKTDKIDGLSKYDLFVIYHTPEEAPGAHWGPAFLPYHRELLKQ